MIAKKSVRTFLGRRRFQLSAFYVCVFLEHSSINLYIRSTYILDQPILDQSILDHMDTIA